MLSTFYAAQAVVRDPVSLKQLFGTIEVGRAADFPRDARNSRATQVMGSTWFDLAQRSDGGCACQQCRHPRGDIRGAAATG